MSWQKNKSYRRFGPPGQADLEVEGRKPNVVYVPRLSQYYQPYTPGVYDMPRNVKIERFLKVDFLRELPETFFYEGDKVHLKEGTPGAERYRQAFNLHSEMVEAAAGEVTFVGGRIVKKPHQMDLLLGDKPLTAVVRSINYAACEDSGAPANHIYGISCDRYSDWYVTVGLSDMRQDVILRGDVWRFSHGLPVEDRVGFPEIARFHLGRGEAHPLEVPKDSEYEREAYALEKVAVGVAHGYVFIRLRRDEAEMIHPVRFVDGSYGEKLRAGFLDSKRGRLEELGIKINGITRHLPEAVSLGAPSLARDRSMLLQTHPQTG